MLANNSHGDASMASIDTDYEFIGVLRRKSDEKYTFSDKNLGSYFITKKTNRNHKRTPRRKSKRELDTQNTYQHTFSEKANR